MLRSLLFAVFVTLAACKDGPVVPPLLPVSVEPLRAYAGAPIRIVSARFRTGDSIRLYIDSAQLEIARRARDTVVAYLPSTARGLRELRIDTPLSGVVIAQLDISGFAAYRPIATDIGYYLDVWPEGGIASVIGGRMMGGVPTGEVVQLLPKTGSIRTLIDGFNVAGTGPRTPGQTPDPGVLLLQPMNGGNLQAWRLLPDTQFIRTIAIQNPRHFAQFSDSIFFRGTHHWIETLRLRGDRFETIYQGWYEETHRVYISPAKDRATLRVNGSATGPPVFNTLTGDTAYHVRQLFRSYGAAFSAGGDTLWMVGATPELIQQPEFTTYATALLSLNARTGQVHKRISQPGYDLTALAYDRATDRLFVSATPMPTKPVTSLHLFVVRASDLEVVGHAATPASITCPDFCDFPVIAVGFEGVFVVQSNAIFEFDR